ncbi:MAG: DUF3800 domain-containing protein [Campylobacterales bacterium]
MKIVVCLDESGDLGWKLSSPYRYGGSSRYLTIASVLMPHNKRHLPKRVIKKLYEKYHWNPQEEKKWSEMTHAERLDFAKKASSLQLKHPDIKYFSITVNKQNVQTHIRQDGNKLYNYMIGLLLLDEMSKYDEIQFTPDPRSIKVESGNSLHDYLVTKLWFDYEVKTDMKTKPEDSASNKNVQFADMLSGVAQGYFEDKKTGPWTILSKQINYKKLYF